MRIDGLPATVRYGSSVAVNSTMSTNETWSPRTIRPPARIERTGWSLLGALACVALAGCQSDAGDAQADSLSGTDDVAGESQTRDNDPGNDDEPDDGDGGELDGKQIFRHDTFGDEQLWTDTLRMHEVIASSVDPTTALSVGLKVDADAVPPEVLESADLNDPATTVALLELDAVVGLKGEVDEAGNLVSVGTTCALCHSTVDDSVAPGIGSRLDAWPNRDLDPGAIIALSPAVTDEQREVYMSWGPGFYDPRFNQDGINGPVLIPPAYGLDGVELETYTGDGPVTYWNAYVAITQMGGKGDFEDPRIGVSIDQEPDLVTSKLPALRDYQLSIAAPPPPEGTFDPAAAERGREVFEGAGQCASCHAGETYTDAGEKLHAAEETGVDPAYAKRSATGLYRTTPLRGLWQHPPYFHDGSAQTLEDVVDHYNKTLNLCLTKPQKRDLVQFLQSL
jgi:cytochrome c5